MSALICFALKEEATPFRKIADGKSGLSILVVGIGRQNAEKSTRDFLAGGASVPASRGRVICNGDMSVTADKSLTSFI